MSDEQFIHNWGGSAFFYYNDLVEKGYIWRYFEMLGRNKTYKLVGELTAYYNGYNALDRVLELQLLDIKQHYRDYKEYIEQQENQTN